MATINIKDKESLKSMIVFLGKVNGDVENVDVYITTTINLFPFLELSDIEALDYEHIMLITKVLSFFVNIDKMNLKDGTKYLNCILGFLKRQIVFSCKQEGNLELTCDLILVFTRFLQSLNLKNLLAMPLVDFWNTTLFNSSYLKEAYYQNVISLTLIEVLKLPCLNSSDLGLLVKSIDDFLKFSSELRVGYKIIICKKLIELGRNDKFIFDLIPSFVLETEHCELHEISDVIDCSIICFSLVKDDGALLDSLCQNWTTRRRGFNTVLKEFQIKTFELLSCIINHNFPTWERCDIMNQIYLMESNRNLKIDLTYVMYYLKFIYCGEVDINDTLINTGLAKNLTNSLATNPPVIKSMLLLYCAYAGRAEKNEIVQIEQIILQSLTCYENLDLILANHISQMIWILNRGNYYLKLRVLVLWMRDEKNHDNLKKSMKLCKCKHLILDLLKEFDHPENNNLLFQINTFNDFLYSLLNPTTDLQDNKRLYKRVVGKLSITFPEIKNPNLLDCIMRYIVKLLSNIEVEPIVVKPFFSAYIVSFLINTAKGTDDILAESALIILKILIIHQKLFKIWSSVTHEMDLASFLGSSSTRNKKALILIKAVLRNNSYSIIRSEFPALNLHQKLLSITDCLIISHVCNTLSDLILVQENISISVENMYFFKTQCRSLIDNDEFIRFLKNWLEIVLNQHPFVKVPVAVIKSSLKNMKKSKSHHARRISQLLSKIEKKHEIYNSNF